MLVIKRVEPRQSCQTVNKNWHALAHFCRRSRSYGKTMTQPTETALNMTSPGHPRLK